MVRVRIIVRVIGMGEVMGVGVGVGVGVRIAEEDLLGESTRQEKRRII